jgi:hypothetical protein
MPWLIYIENYRSYYTCFSSKGTFKYSPCNGEYRHISTCKKDAVDVPREWGNIMHIAKHCQSPFKVVIHLEQGNIFHDMQASLHHHFPSNPKPRLLAKSFNMYQVRDNTEVCLITQERHVTGSETLTW